MAARSMIIFVKSLPSLLKETAAEWIADNAMRLAAALAYYTAFSLAPLLLAAISIAGLIFGGEAASGKIYAELGTAVGPSIAGAVQEMVAAASKPSTGITGTILAFALALFGASGVFGELMSSLNQIWGSEVEKGGGIMRWIRGRFLSIGMVMGVCFLLMVSMVTSSVLTAIGSFGIPGLAGGAVLLWILNQLLSLGVTTVLFSAMFKYLPATRIEWRDVWVGGAVTAVLFSVGKLGLEQYVARAAPASSFGAASALALLLVWVYYSAQIFLFGAEFTEVYARRLGSRFRHSAPRHRKNSPNPGPEPDRHPIAGPALSCQVPAGRMAENPAISWPAVMVTLSLAAASLIVDKVRRR